MYFCISDKYVNEILQRNQNNQRKWGLWVVGDKRVLNEV